MKNRPQTWYLMAADCKAKTHLLHSDLPNIEVEVTAFNDNSHFSQEEKYELEINVFFLFVFSAIFGKSLSRYLTELKKGENMDTPLLILIIAMLSEIGHLMLDSLHLFSYSYNGQGIWLFDVFQNLFSMLSQFLLTFLILLIAHGWTITY